MLFLVYTVYQRNKPKMIACSEPAESLMCAAIKVVAMQCLYVHSGIVEERASCMSRIVGIPTLPSVEVCK